MITKRITKHRKKSECVARLTTMIIYRLPTIHNAKLLSPLSSHPPIEIICSEINVHLDSSSINLENTKRILQSEEPQKQSPNSSSELLP